MKEIRFDKCRYSVIASTPTGCYLICRCVCSNVAITLAKAYKKELVSCGIQAFTINIYRDCDIIWSATA